MKDRDRLEARKERLEGLKHESLVRKALKLQDEVDSLRSELLLFRKQHEDIIARLESETMEKRKLEREKRLRGIPPMRLIVERCEVMAEQDVYAEEYANEIPEVICDTIIAMEFEVYLYNMSGYHLCGVDANYEEFDVSEVIAYTTPDGKRHQLGAGDGDDQSE